MLLQLITILITISCISSNFTVFSPMSLRLELEKIPYSIANFGNIPYGKKMTGRLVVAEPITACKPIQPYPLESKHDKKTMNFVLISRGECTFVQKSYQAQLLGAKMAIIYDNVDEVTEKIIMVEDGHGDEINIPTIIISKTIGERLVKEINGNPDNEVDMVISFDMLQQEDVNYIFWLNIRNRESYHLVRTFTQYAKELEMSNHVHFQPHYFLDGSFFTGRANSENCYNDGKYCFMDPDGWGPAHGTDMIDEIIRQICIFNAEPDKWWSYMDRVDTECYKYSALKECSTKIMDSLNINSNDIQNCYDTSQSSSTNELLDKELELSRGRAIWPGVSVNNMTYRGNLYDKDILEVICASLKEQPHICKRNIKNYTIIEDHSHGLSKTALIILVVVLLFCFFLFLILAYRKWYQKELHIQMDQKVNPMVNQYIAFYETKSQSVKHDI